LFAGRHEEALAWAERSLAEPHVQWSRHALRAAALGQLGRPADARESIRALKAMLPEVTVQALDRLWPISAEPARARLLEGLRRAGVPESAPAPGAEH
jgi:hypothetical protein